MIKYLEIPDFHFSKQWAETSVSASLAVKKAAMENNVDFIAIVGDFFDAPIYASDKGGMRIAKKIIKSWTDICPVVAVEGTPSHDAPGCYGLFEEVILLEPGKVYGLHEFKIMEEDGYGFTPDCILFGIPEIKKSHIQSQLNLSGEQANAEAINLFNNYIKEFVAPMRMKYKDVPAVGLLHGNVSDSARSNETDIILKASDIVIYTEDLEPADLDRWSIGHIHTPWESKKICAGYAGFPGMDRNPWGKRDFLPAFNMIEITDESSPRVHDIYRLPYGTPERRKVTGSHIREWDTGIAYWLDTDNPEAELPGNIHPWSRITYSETKTETRRVTEEEAAGATSLWDLFKLIDPEVPKKLKSKVDKITETIQHETPDKKDVRLLSVKIKGAIFFGGKDIELDISKLPEGLNLINGENGSGKSSLLSFCHPYPYVIGKDKSKTLKTFFNKKDSMIEKRLMLNGQEHHHLITIKGAHTNTAKTECYLSIDGIPQLEKSTFDDMLQMCENLYGSVLDYRITSFCEQPQQATSNLSGLMSAKPVDARNLIQTIAGVDREAEKRYALDKFSEEEKSIKENEIRIETLKETITDESQTEETLREIEYQIGINKANLQELESNGKIKSNELESLKGFKIQNDEALNKKNQLTETIGNIHADISHKEKEISGLSKIIEDLPLLREKIDINNRSLLICADIDETIKSNNELKISYMEISEAYNYTLREAKDCEDTFDKIIRESETEIFNNLEKMQLINKPCEHCGKLPSDVQASISGLSSRNNELDELMTNAKISKEALIYPDAPIQPIYKDVPVKPETLTAFEIESINADIKTAESAADNIERLNKVISDAKKTIKTLDTERSHIIIDNTVNDRISEKERLLSEARKDYENLRVEIEGNNQRIKALKEKLSAIETQKNTIKTLQDEIKNSGVEDWKYIAKMLGSDKIPALELDMVLASIDAEATRNIEPFMEGRYSFRTTTQEKGIDRFDILVTDLETGMEVSLFVKNPGHKAFFSDAYIKALIRQRNQRIDRSYSPIIFDESDAPIKENWIPMYYEINQRYYEKDNATVLIVSQKDSATNYMSNVIQIEEVKS
jgi:hypothetical protein